MNKAYNAINWKNEPSTSTAINETNLNKMDRAIDTIDDRVIDLDNGKVNKEEFDAINSNLSEYKDNGYLPKNLFNADNYGHYVYSVTIGSDLTQTSSDRYGVSGMLDGSKDITVSIVTGEVVALLWGIKNNKIAYHNDFASITSKTYKGGQYDYWVVGFGLKSLGTITSDIMKNNKCMAEYGSSATNYVPYFNSVSDINESLGDYGLDGIHNIEMLQGYPSNEDITATYNNSNYVCSKNTYECNGDDKIVVKNKYTNGLVYFYDSSKAYISGSEFPCTAPTNAKYFRFRIGYVENITPQTVGKISVYINNAIDELKNDLSEKLKVISVSLSDVMVSAMSSTTVDLPKEYIDAGYVIANILSKPDTGLSYTTGSETSIIIRNNTNSAVAFVPTTTVKVLIAKIG